ncbi:MAG: hypothetical protein M3R36_11465 [Bacteroidota bacterium]|nr:hypothetical protein [Bacteroidota bacterium]
MKLRISGNSIRLRLSKSEVEKLSHNGSLEEHALFGKNVFSYALQCKADCSELCADFEKGKITVFIPESFIKDWAENDVIGFDTKMETSNNELLNILVEKDFKCLDETEEDQSDNYENPNRLC